MDGTDVTDGTDGLDGALVGQGWDRPTLAGAGTGVPPLALEGPRSAGCGKWWLAPIASVLQGRGVFVSEKQNNTNRLHKNWN